MHSLRHCSRRGQRLFQATVSTQETCVVSLRAYSAETTSCAKPRKSKEERHELVMQFVTKFKASNNGQLPGISLLRKEVGGSYQILKEILQGIEKGQDEGGISGQKAEFEKVECKTKEPVLVGKDGHRRESNLNAIEEEDLKEDKKLVAQVTEMPKPSEITKAVNPADLRMATKDVGQMIRSVVSVHDASQSVVDTSLASDGEDDDSDVAAPEYNQTEEGLNAAKMKEKVLVKGQVVYPKSGSMRQNEYQATKSNTSEVKTTSQQRGPVAVNGVVQSKNNSAAKHAPLDGKFEFGDKNHQLTKQTNPFTTVVRILNLPSHVTASKLRSTCETIASVHGLEMHRGGIADVHFNVKDNSEMNVVADRLRKVTLGENKLKVFPAPKFFCGKDVNNEFKPQDVSRLRQVKDTVFKQFEQRIKQLCTQVQDYRDLLAMKREM